MRDQARELLASCLTVQEFSRLRERLRMPRAAQWLAERVQVRDAEFHALQRDGDPAELELAALLGAAQTRAHPDGSCPPSTESSVADTLLECAAAAGNPLQGPLAELAAAAADRNAKPSLPTIDAIDGYRLVDICGSGSQATVFRALAPDGQRVAIKVARVAAWQGEAQDRFQREVRILQALDHPTIAKVLHHGRTFIQGMAVPYYVMEFLGGGRLVDWLERSACSAKERVTKMTAVVRAIERAHAHSILHRDLSANNILVTTGGQPRIADFGIAREGGRTTATATGMAFGTRSYASPEQLRGDPLIDVRTDVYALGCVLLHALSGRTPPPRESGFGQELTELVRVTDPGLRAIVRKATSADPTSRYPTAAAFADDLERWTDGMRPHARSATLWSELGDWTRRHRRRLQRWLASAVGLGILFVVWQLQQSASQRARELEQRQAEWANLAGVVTDLRHALTSSMAPELSVHLSGRLLPWAVRSARTLAEGQRDDAAWSGLAEVLQLQGDALVRGGDFTKARTVFAEVAELRERLVRSKTDSSKPQERADRWRRLAEWSIALVRLGDLSPVHRRAALYRQAYILDHQIYSASGEDPEFGDNLVWSRTRPALRAMDAGQFRLSLELLEPALELAIALHAGEPEELLRQRTLGHLQLYRCRALLEVGRTAAAIRWLEPAMRTFEAVQANHPEDIQALEDMLNAQIRSATVYRVAGRFDAASEAIERGLRSAIVLMTIDSASRRPLRALHALTNQALWLHRAAPDFTRLRHQTAAIRAELQRGVGLRADAAELQARIRELDRLVASEPR